MHGRTGFREEYLEANKVLNGQRRNDGGPDIGVDVVLHLGEVFYGNIGARGRLDFTVIGSAVNEASRLEKLCGMLEQDLLMSESFATSCAVACSIWVRLNCAAFRSEQRCSSSPAPDHSGSDLA